MKDLSVDPASQAVRGTLTETAEISWLISHQNVAPPTGVKVCVIGGGFVGLVTATGLAQAGHSVTCVEKDKQKAADLAAGKVAIFEQGLSELLQANLQRDRLTFTTDLAGSVSGQDMIVISVGTPSTDDGQADLSAFTEVIRDLARSLRSGQVVTIKSTVPVCTALFASQLLNEGRNGQGPIPVVSNPEFLREGTAVYDFFHPRRIVVGGNDPIAVEKVVQVYRAGLSRPAPIVVTSNETAEMIKYASNVYLAMRIAYINELSAVCDALDIEVADVSSAMGLDPRIGPDYLDVGPGFGGSCLPKDLNAFVAGAQRVGVNLAIAPAVREANERQLDRVAEKVRAIVGGDLKDMRIGVLGLSFKAQTQDMRDSPSMAVVLRLLAHGATVQAFDPAAMEEARRLLPQVRLCATAAEAGAGADAIVILTEWPEFQLLDWAGIGRLMRSARLVDSRNLLSPEILRRHGFEYIGMGQK
ncbi:MAG: nucleotide sugar dehydrogenase [candidate division Zixibacteria bacterium]|nr:nucleotide sugar dehydrogenase [candidate division Zixibacteria bacterium]